VNYFAKIFKQKHNIDIMDPEHRRAASRMKREVENAKRILSSQSMTKVEVE